VRPAISDATFEGLNALLDAPISGGSYRPAWGSDDVAPPTIAYAVSYNARRARLSRILVAGVIGLAFAWVGLCAYVGFSGG
jgi:hypothetical protein